MATSADTSPMQSNRIRRHTMIPSHAVSSVQTASSPGTRRAYPSPPSSDRGGTNGMDIKKKPRAMSEMASEIAGSMTCEVCGKGYKHASCLSKHR